MSNGRVLHAMVLCCFGAFEATAAPHVALRDCRLESAIGGGGAPARCGELIVPARREDASAGVVRLRLAVIPALRLEPQRDPVFILSGGPGQAASDFYLSVGPAFARIRRDRDIVLLDQRGTGRSNRLDCEFPDEGALLETDVQAVRAAAQSCLDKLSADPRDYTTSIAVRDLDEVRAALGYDQINVYAVSYGTRVAQHYMRRFPSRVRTAILDGVAPPDLALGPDTPLVVQHALDAIFARCAAQPECQRRFPDLTQQFIQLQSELRRGARRLEIAHPDTGLPITVEFGAPQMSAAVRLLSYADETAALLPLLIDAAAAHQRPDALAAHYLMVEGALTQQLAQGMQFAVICSEDAPRWSRHIVDRAALERSYMGAAFMEAMTAICEVWPRGPVDADFYEPLVTSTPILMLSGSADPATPASYAERVAPGFKRSAHLVLEGQGHGQITSGCIPRLAAQFIDEGSFAKLDMACAKDVTPAPFMLSTTAPAP